MGEVELVDAVAKAIAAPILWEYDAYRLDRPIPWEIIPADDQNAIRSIANIATSLILESLSAKDRMIEELREALSAAIGYMMNAGIDLETGETKRKAIATLKDGIDKARTVLDSRA